MLLLSMLNLACQGSVSKAASAYGLSRWLVYYGNNMTVKLPWDSLQHWPKICNTDLHQPSTLPNRCVEAAENFDVSALPNVYL